jgi:hypothetical protein
LVMPGALAVLPELPCAEAPVAAPVLLCEVVADPELL